MVRVRHVGTVQRRLRAEAASAGAEGAENSPARCRAVEHQNRWPRISPSFSCFHLISPSFTSGPLGGCHAPNLEPAPNLNPNPGVGFPCSQRHSSPLRPFKRIQADSSRFNQIQALKKNLHCLGATADDNQPHDILADLHPPSSRWSSASRLVSKEFKIVHFREDSYREFHGYHGWKSLYPCHP